jgi:hypothetical protein
VSSEATALEPENRMLRKERAILAALLLIERGDIEAAKAVLYDELPVHLAVLLQKAKRT